MATCAQSSATYVAEPGNPNGIREGWLAEAADDFSVPAGKRYVGRSTTAAWGVQQSAMQDCASECLGRGMTFTSAIGGIVKEAALLTRPLVFDCGLPFIDAIYDLPGVVSDYRLTLQRIGLPVCWQPDGDPDLAPRCLFRGSDSIFISATLGVSFNGTTDLAFVYALLAAPLSETWRTFIDPPPNQRCGFCGDVVFAGFGQSIPINQGAGCFASTSGTVRIEPTP